MRDLESQDDRLLRLEVTWRHGGLSALDAWVRFFMASKRAIRWWRTMSGSCGARADRVGVAVGYPMAKNLRAKMPKEDTLFIRDRNTEIMAKFVDEVGNGVEVAKSAREVAEKAVRRPSPYSTITRKSI